MIILKNSKKDTKSFTHKILIIVLLIIQLVVLLYFGSLKKGMHFDECFSYFNTNNSFGRLSLDRTFDTKEEIMKDFYVLPGEQFNYPYVIKLQSYDVHPPFYYLLLHTVCSFTPMLFSIWQGVGLNIFFALITTVFIYLIVKYFCDNPIVCFCITLFSVLTPGAISNVMFIRMYCLMTLEIVLCIFLHLKMNKYSELNRLPVICCILGGGLAFVGFMTHYFFLVFLFFIEAAFFLSRLKGFKNNVFGLLKYYGSILLCGILGIVFYPSCLGHVNSGYRGVQVKSYLFDLSDITSRIKFFNGLINDYVFSGSFYIFILIIVLLLLTLFVLKKKKGNKDFKNKELILNLIIPVIGYYLISTKASLIGEESMMRYQLPIYSLIIVVFGLIMYKCILGIFGSLTAQKMIGAVICLTFSVFMIFRLINNGVFFLYPEQEKMEETASEHSSEVCIYIYNNENSHTFMWNDFAQLAKFDEIYYLSSENLSSITEQKIADADKLFVYVSTLGEHSDFSDYENLIFSSNSNVKEYTHVYDGMYAKAYEFY